MAMAAAGSLKGVGVPVKLLHEAEGHVVSVSAAAADDGRALLLFLLP